MQGVDNQSVCSTLSLGAAPTVWTTPPIPPKFTAGVAAKTSKQLTNQRTGSLAMTAFAASHCAAGPCDWTNISVSPKAFGQGSGYVGIKVVAVKDVIKVGDFACHMAGNLSYNWWLPGLKQGPQGTPVFLTSAATVTPDALTYACDAYGCWQTAVTSDMVDTTNVAEGSDVDESLYGDLLSTVSAIPTEERSYEDFLAQTSAPTDGTTVTTATPDAGATSAPDAGMFAGSDASP